MRQEYNELAKVDGLTVGTSYGTIKLVQEIHDIKQHTENFTNNMKEEFKQTLQAFYINQSETPYWSPPTQLPTQPGEKKIFNSTIYLQSNKSKTSPFNNWESK